MKPKRFRSLIRSIVSFILALGVLMSNSPAGWALTTISTSVTWTDPAPLTDSLVITNTGILRILSSGGVNGGNLTLNLPAGGIFDLQGGGLLNLSGISGNGNGGNLLINLMDSTGTINIAGTIRSNGLGTGSGGVINLNGSTYNLAGTGVIEALGGTAGGNGGSVSLANASGLINLPASFRIKTNGLTDATHNLIDIQGSGVNVDGLLNADGILTADGGTIKIRNTGSGNVVVGSTANLSATNVGTGGRGGNIRITSTTSGNVSMSGLANVNSKAGKNGGTVELTSAGNLNVTNARIAASASVGGDNAGDGGTITLTAGNDINVSSNTINTVLSANGSENPTTFLAGAAGDGGTITFNAGRDISLSSNQAATSTSNFIQANGATGSTPGSGGTISFTGRNLSVSHNLAAPRRMLMVTGGAGRAANSGAGGSITATLTGGTTVTNSIVSASAGGAAAGFDANMPGQGGTIDLNMAGDYNSTNGQLFADAKNAGTGGEISIISSAGDILLNDSKSYVRNWTNGTGSVTLQGDNITNNGVIASRAGHKDSDGGTINLTTAAGGTLINNGSIDAAAFTPGLDFIPNMAGIYADSTGSGGTVNINAGNVQVNGTSGVTKTGQIFAYGGLNLLGNPQGTGGNININATNSLAMNADAFMDTRGTPAIDGGGNYTNNKINIQAGTATIAGKINASGYYAGDSGGNIRLTTTAGDLNVTNTALVSTSGGLADLFNNQGSGGQLYLNAQNGNVFINGIVQSLGTGAHAGGTVDILASQNINLNSALVSTSGGLSSGLARFSAGNNISAANSNVISATTTFQANNQVIANAGNVFSGLIDIYGDGGINDYVNLADVANSSGDLRINRITAVNSTLSNGQAGANLVVNNGSFSGTVSMTSQKDVTVSNSTIDGTDTVRISSLGNGNVTLNNNSLSSLTGKTSLLGTETNGLYIGTGTGTWNLAGNTISGGTNITGGNSITGASGSYGGTVSASGTTVSLTANSGNITAGTVNATSGAAQLVASNGGVLVGAGASVSGATTATLTSGNSNMNISGSVSGPSGVNLTSSGTVTVNGVASVTGEINGTAQSINLTQGSLSLGNVNATAGAVTATATAGNVTTTAAKTVSGSTNVTLTSNTANVNINGGLSAGSLTTLNAANGSVTSAAGTSSIAGTVTGTARSYNLATNNGSLTLGSITSTAGAITANAANGSLTTNDASTIAATGGTVSLTSGTGNIVSNATLNSASGLNLTAGNGTITGGNGAYQGTLNATGRSINLTNASGNLTLGNVSGTAGDVTLLSSVGSITTTAGNTVSSTGILNLTSNTSNITNAGALSGNVVNMNAANGTVISDATSSLSGTIQAAGRGVSLTPGSGGITLGNVSATAGNVTVTAPTFISGLAGKTISASGTTTLTANNGNISTSNNLSGTTITLNAANGVISSSGAFTGNMDAAARSMSLTATSGNASFRNIDSSAGNTMLRANNGNVTTVAGFDISSTNRLDVISDTGTVTVDGDLRAPNIYVTANGAGGSVSLLSTILTARNASNTGGNINVQSAGAITLTNADLFADDTGTGLGGTVSISAGGALNLDSASSIQTNGLSDGTHNIITLQGGSINNNAPIFSRGDSANGGSGGQISLTSTSGAITSSGNLSAIGYANNNTVAGNGGTVTINAATDYTQNATGDIDTYSQPNGRNVGLGNANWGGDVSITAGNTVTFNHSATTTNAMIDTRGASYGSGNGSLGGDGGDITITAPTSILLRHTAGGTPTYFDARGGNSRGSGNVGGDGGNVNFNVTSGSLTIDGYNILTNFNTLRGTGSPNGTSGVVRKNGVQLF